MGSIYVICSRQCPNGDGIYTLLYALYKYSTSITNQPIVSILSTVHLTYICDINYMRTSRHHTHRRLLNTLRPRQNGRHFADDTFKRIFFNENVRISLKISLKFVQITYDMIVSLYGLPIPGCQYLPTSQGRTKVIKTV